ncbi:MAG: DUF1330 domain-containing protein [Chloroflexi bacterium]|nr:DUF1330 domain-containing protein [Chloroflexota bacterium]
MAAYIIFEVEVTDPEATDEYAKLAGESLAPLQAKPIIHGGMVEVLDGDWEPKTLVMVEFESMEQARQWYKSPAYAKAKDVLIPYSNVILIEGV